MIQQMKQFLSVEGEADNLFAYGRSILARRINEDEMDAWER
jgi:hypothetical protein